MIALLLSKYRWYGKRNIRLCFLLFTHQSDRFSTLDRDARSKGKQETRGNGTCYGSEKVSLDRRARETNSISLKLSYVDVG
eukprot:scaffold12176_cov144-Skeletonema_marinoi.AAC.29